MQRSLEKGSGWLSHCFSHFSPLKILLSTIHKSSGAAVQISNGAVHCSSLEHYSAPECTEPAAMHWTQLMRIITLLNFSFSKHCKPKVRMLCNIEGREGSGLMQSAAITDDPLECKTRRCGERLTPSITQTPVI